MSRRMYLTFSSVGLSIFLVFLLTFLSIPAFARTLPGKSPVSLTPRLINTDVICQPDFFVSTAGHPWVQTRNGPASFGCSGYAMQATTPSGDSASWNAGNVESNLGAKYSLRAFITGPSDAIVDYRIFVGALRNTCTINQSLALIAWNSVCSFTIYPSDRGQPVTILVSSNQASPRTMSASAIQLLVSCQIC